MQLTKNFSLEELTKSSTASKLGIKNEPDKEQIENMKVLCETIMQPIRDEWKDAIVVSSGYRSPKVNTAVKGSKTSQHMTGAACDFSAKDKSKNGELFRLIDCMIKQGKIKCRQLIWEYGDKKNPRWIHISCQDKQHQYRENQRLYYYD